MHSSALIMAVTLCSPAVGCGTTNLLPSRTFHQRCGWTAEDYFTDPQMIALCKAIEPNDLAEMDLYLMYQLHLMPNVLYGWLVTEGRFGGFTIDMLGYDAYFGT